MRENERRLVIMDDLSEVAIAVATSTGGPLVSVVFEEGDGGVAGCTVRPYSLERCRGGLGRFVVKGDVLNGSVISGEIVIYIDPFAEDGDGSRVEFRPPIGPTT